MFVGRCPYQSIMEGCEELKNFVALSIDDWVLFRVFIKDKKCSNHRLFVDEYNEFNISEY